MLSDVNKILEIVSQECSVSEQHSYFYITTTDVIDTVKKLRHKGFDSLTDCFVTNTKLIYLQLTNFDTRQSLFVVTQYDEMNKLQKLFKNFNAYELDMMRYINEH